MNYSVGTVRYVTVRYTESCPMWYWRRLEGISWNERVKNEDILEEMWKRRRRCKELLGDMK